MKMKLANALILAVTLALVLTIVPAMAYFNEVSFDGQGGSVLQTGPCGAADGADAGGSYLLWTLTAPGARNAEISGPWGNAVMTRDGNGTFSYISGWQKADDLAAHPVRAAYDGKPQQAWLVVSRVCDTD